MPRSHRRFSRLRPTGGAPISRVGQAMFMLIIVVLIYSRARDPETWRFLAGGNAVQADDDAPKEVKPASKAVAGESKTQNVEEAPKEEIVPGPTDTDEKDVAEIQKQFENLLDKQPISIEDMPAYWHLFRWIRAQPFAEAEKRARRNVRFASFFEAPERQRGQLVRLKARLKMIVEDDKYVKNSAGVKKVYECWGWTDDSKSYPYVFEVDSLPPGIKPGQNRSDEVVFCGYFLKTFSYTAYDKTRFAPVLIGRFKPTPAPTKKVASNAAPAGMDWLWIGLVIIAGVLVLCFWTWRPRRPASLKSLEGDHGDPDFNAMFGDEPAPPHSQHPHGPAFRPTSLPITPDPTT